MIRQFVVDPPTYCIIKLSMCQIKHQLVVHHNPYFNHQNIGRSFWSCSFFSKCLFCSGTFLTSFYLFFVFLTVNRKSKLITTIADGCIRTRVLWCWKRLFCRLSHNHWVPKWFFLIGNSWHPLIIFLSFYQ